MNLSARERFESIQLHPLAKILSLPEAERETKGLLHTPREIFQQPETWGRSYEKLSLLAPAVKIFLEHAGLRKPLRERPSIFLVGAGTSDYVGKTLAALLRKRWQCEVRAVASTDLLTGLDDFVVPERSYLWLSFSRSGDSSEGVAVLESALDHCPEIHHVIVCCNAEGRMARAFSDRANVCPVILGEEVNDRGLAMTSSFSNMVVAGQCLAHLQDLSAYRATLDGLIAGARNFLPAAARVAGQLVGEGFSRICFLGTGPLKGVAVESGLKVLELTAGGVVTFAESFLGLRHGPLSAIDGETLVVGFLSSNARRRSYEIDLLSEIRDKKLAKKTLVIAPIAHASDLKGLGDEAIVLPVEVAVADYYRPPVDVIFGQLLGLFASIKLGLKPDAPSPRAAISRVVTEVKIY